MTIMTKIFVVFKDWVCVHVGLMSMLANLIEHLSDLAERVERLEHGQFHGQRVHTIYVPEGLSPEVAWAECRDNQVFERTGHKTYILADVNGNLLRVL